MKQCVGKGSVLAVVMFGKEESEPAEWCHRDNGAPHSGYGIFGLRFGPRFCLDAPPKSFSSISAAKRDRVQSTLLYNSCKILTLKDVSLLVCLTCTVS
jgi:hypothetical protein